MADVKMLAELILTHPTPPYEPTCVPMPWKSDVVSRQLEGKKLCFGLMMTDGVVDPHPPIKRAMLETAEKLRAAGHEGMY